MMLRTRPLVAVAVLLIIGIVAARSFGMETGMALGALGFSAVFLFIRKLRPLALAAVLVTTGMTLYSARYRIASATDARVVLGEEPELVTVRGRLLETPSLREFQAGSNAVFYSQATIELAELGRQRQWQPISGRIAVTTRGELSADFFQGRSVEVTGVINLPPSAAAPGLFDYRAYLHNLRIFHQLRSDSTNDWALVSYEKMPVTEQFRRWAQFQLQRGLPEKDERVDMIWAMTLGLRNSMEAEMSETFMRTGTMHIVAISGLHVACISYVLYWIFVRGVGLSRPVGGILVLAITWFYTVATGLQSSAVRSAIMASVFILGWMVRRPSDLLNTLAASAILILCVQPEQLFQAGFQLSFCVVAVIALVVLLFDRHYPEAQVQFRHRVLRIDPLLPYELTPAWKKVADRALALALGNFVVSFASWIGSLPLGAYYFNTVTPVGLIANLFAVPFSSVSLASAVLSLLIPPLGPFCNYIGWAFMFYTIEATELFAQIPFGYFYVAKPNGFFFAFYAVALLVLLIPRLRSGRLKPVSASLTAVWGVVWLGSLVIQSRSTTITVLPCAGTPAFVEVSGEEEFLIDCSSERDAEYVVKRFLRAKGYGSIERLLLTHGDAHNAGGFAVLWADFRPRQVHTSVARARSPIYRKAIRVLEEHPTRWKTISTGDRVDGWEVLHPEKGRGFPRADDNSVVLRRLIQGWTVLHISDLGAQGQKQLLESGADLRADIVISGMPEAGEPLGAELLDAILARTIILGTTKYPYTAGGTPELRTRLEKSKAEVFYTTEEDAVTVTFDKDVCEVNGMKGQTARLSTARHR
jgi:competence protein ComEC